MKKKRKVDGKGGDGKPGDGEPKEAQESKVDQGDEASPTPDVADRMKKEAARLSAARFAAAQAVSRGGPPA
eukprot:9460578-Pyramimonas_sp.AAC.1